ncbi:MAG: ester cyclase [Bacteroidota bacterium]
METVHAPRRPRGHRTAPTRAKTLGCVGSWKRSFKGTHKANMQGIPASNKAIVWEEMVVSRFENGKISEEHLVSDLAAQLLLKQSLRPKA